MGGAVIGTVVGRNKGRCRGSIGHGRVAAPKCIFSQPQFFSDNTCVAAGVIYIIDIVCPAQAYFSLAEKLGIALKAHILPLGADVISSVNKTFDSLHLLYVGTLFNRNIDTVLFVPQRVHIQDGIEKK